MKNYTLVSLCFLFTLNSIAVHGSNISVPPIELVEFNATLNDENDVDVNWSTAIEIGNDFFTIERTRDGITYETVVIVDGAGTTTQPRNYSIVDNAPYSGLSYYRLKQTDLNGISTYSEIVAINYEPTDELAVGLSPNPGDGESIQLSITANAEEQIQVVVYDASGKACHAETFISDYDGVSYFKIDFTERLSPGVYFVMVNTSGIEATTLPVSTKIIVK